MTTLPPLLGRSEIHARLEKIFPPGLTNRNYITREMAASTVFVMLYLGAIDGADYYVRPDQVTRMDDAQAARTSDQQRLAWRKESMRSGGTGGWYARNTREPIRDETLRHGLVHYGAAVELQGLPTSSPLGRYALSESFVELFAPHLTGETLEQAVQAWRDANLSPSAQARLRLLRRATVETEGGLLVTFPNGETRRLASGPSSEITKAVAERFAPRYLKRPGVLRVSESGQRETYRDVQLLDDLGITLQTDRVLPDMILVDLDEATDRPLFIFVEVVATDGPITEERREVLLRLITDAGYSPDQAAFVTAYLDRDHAAFKSTMPALAWRSFAWFLSEPENIIGLHAPTPSQYLSDFL
jgi:hypothetical protein